jgi:putative transposase
VIRAYRYKLAPNRQQKYALARTLDCCRELYNDALQQRRWSRCTRFNQQAELRALKKEFPFLQNVHSQVLQSVLGRLDKAFKNFFRSGFGFPRFKNEYRFNSFQYPQSGFSLEGKYLKLSKIGNVKVRLSRHLPQGAKVKTCTIKRTVSGWFVTLVFEYEPVPLPKSDLAVGIDVGVTTFATFSDGTMIENPRVFQQSESRLRRAQRRVARRNKGSNRRRKAIVLVQKIHKDIVNRRLDFLYKTSTSVIRKYGTIVVESLNIHDMSRSKLAKQILDSGWSQWFRQLSYKAEEAGRTFIAVDPRYTSQTCSECGYVSKENRKTQADFVCMECGYSDNADHNGALNILARVGPLNAKIGELISCLV